MKYKILDMDLPTTSSNRSSMIDSPGSSILDISISDGNLAAHITNNGGAGAATFGLNGFKKRERHFSGGSLALAPFEESENGFTTEKMANFFQYFVKHKIRFVYIFINVFFYL